MHCWRRSSTTASGILTRIAVARTVLIAASAGAVAGGLDLALVVLLMALDATIAAPSRPAQSRLLPTLAHTPRELTAAAAGISMAKTLGQAFGAVAGGLAVAVVAPSAAMGGGAVLMALAAMLSTGLGASTTSAGEASRCCGPAVDAIPHVFRHREASTLVLASGLRTLTRGLWTALLVVVASRFLRLRAVRGRVAERRGRRRRPRRPPAVRIDDRAITTRQAMRALVHRRRRPGQPPSGRPA